MKFAPCLLLATLLYAGISRPVTYQGYDSLLQQKALEHFPDDPEAWHWIKAKVYCESGFKADAVSRVGARGLMQIMPRTAQDLGGNSTRALDPKWAIDAGTRYTRMLWQYFPYIEDQTSRRALTDASYNSGIGNVLKASLVTQRQGGDKQRWWGGVRNHLVTRPASIKETTDYVDRICYFTKKLAISDR